ncbi:MAG: hypothetical protein V8R52_11715 [Coprobacter fastidiosus]
MHSQLQTFLIGVGAVVASWFPYILANWLGISGTAEAGKVPDNAIFSFYIGAAVLLGTVRWTISHTQEYPPEIHTRFNHANTTETAEKARIFQYISKHYTHA